MDSMDIDNIDNNRVNFETNGARSGGTSVSSIENDVQWLSKSRTPTSTTITFSKSRVFYTYGYAFKRVDITGYAAHSGIATPLCNLWVDFLPSYMSNSEWHQLPRGSIAKEVRVQVKVLGSRTSFETGAALSGIANSQHVPIGIVATNLNNKTYGNNVTYTSNADKPMIPTAITHLDPTKIIDKMYRDEPCMVSGTPRSGYGYWWYRQNKGDNTDASGGNNFGQINLNQFSDTFMVSSATNKVIKNYTYKVKNGLITFPKNHITNVAYDKSKFYAMNGHSVTSKKMVQHNTMYDGQYITSIGKTGEEFIKTDITDDFDDEECLTDNFVKNKYFRSLERPVVYNPRNPYDMSSRFAQPQLHVGILAVPQLSPSTESENFQTTTLYFDVSYELDVEINFNSYTTFSIPSLYPDEVVFYNNLGKGCTSGSTFCGLDNEIKRNTIQPPDQNSNSKKRKQSALSCDLQQRDGCQLLGSSRSVCLLERTPVGSSGEHSVTEKFNRRSISDATTKANIEYNNPYSSESNSSIEFDKCGITTDSEHDELRSGRSDRRRINFINKRKDNNTEDDNIENNKSENNGKSTRHKLNSIKEICKE